MIYYILQIITISVFQSILLNSLIIMLEDGMILSPLKRWLDSIFVSRKKIGSKYRNNQGALWISKPLYRCISCLPSVWSLPLLFILSPLETLLVAISSIYLSTYFYNKF